MFIISSPTFLDVNHNINRGVEKGVNGESVPVVIIIEDAPGVGLGWDPQICESGQMEE